LPQPFHSTAALLALLTTSMAANAADLPVKAPRPAPIIPPPFSWTGFYVGANIGGGWSSNWSSRLDPLPTPTFFGVTPVSFSNNASGIIGGGQIGYNRQFNTNWLFGFETDFQGTNLKGRSTVAPILLSNGVTPIPGSSAFMNRELDWFGTVRGRLGLTYDRWLVYGTGGFAYGEVKGSADFSFFASTIAGDFPLAFPVTFSHTKPGWTAGGGAEYALPGTYGNWTIRAEYLFVSLSGDDSVTSSGVPPQPPPTAVRFTWNRTDFHIARFGLNYKF
jgi:outer membrane immunogenic protein